MAVEECDSGNGDNVNNVEWQGKKTSLAKRQRGPAGSHPDINNTVGCGFSPVPVLFFAVS